MHKPIRFLPPHRRARLIAWALAMLAWLGSVLLGECAPTGRHIRQRCRRFALRSLTRLVSTLAIQRTIEMLQLRPRRRALRNAAPCGFRRRTRPRALGRAIVGARLRKAFRRGDLPTRMAFLVAALADLDGFARRWLAPRGRKRLTRLCAVVAIAPAAASIPPAPARAPAPADSS